MHEENVETIKPCGHDMACSLQARKHSSSCASSLYSRSKSHSHKFLSRRGSFLSCRLREFIRARSHLRAARRSARPILVSIFLLVPLNGNFVTLRIDAKFIEALRNSCHTTQDSPHNTHGLFCGFAGFSGWASGHHHSVQAQEGQLYFNG